jgi:hypothetical protein
LREARSKHANIQATDADLQALIRLTDRLAGIDIDRLTPAELDAWIEELTPPEIKELG